jgi:hypothetical protein
MNNAPVKATSQNTHLLKRIWNGESYGLVLVLIVSIYVLLEAGPTTALTHFVANMLIGTVLVIILRVARVRVQVSLATALLIAIALVFSLALSGVDRSLVFPKFIETVLLVLASLAIVFRILKAPLVTSETIFGALSVYLMIGMFFASADAVLGNFTPFFVSAGSSTMKDYLYFSFITLSTVGYGDLVPKGNLARTLAVIEAILGQLYLVTVVALLVSNYIRRQPPPPLK